MGAIGGEELMKWDKMLQGVASAREEKILVLVRLRPLSEKEIARNEASDWECINDTTILFRNGPQERSMSPTAYTFGKKIPIFFINLLCQDLKCNDPSVVSGQLYVAPVWLQQVLTCYTLNVHLTSPA